MERTNEIVRRSAPEVEVVSEFISPCFNAGKRKRTYQYSDIENVIDFDSPTTQIPRVDTTMEIDSLTESIKTVSIDDGSKKYKRYTPEQVRMFIHIMQGEGTTVPKVAVRCNIPQQSAYRLLKEFNDSNGRVLPGFAPKAKGRGTKQKLFGQHSLFLIDCLNNHKSTTLGLAKEVLLKQFPDLEDISIHSLWKHVTKSLNKNANPATKKRKAKDPEKKKPLKKGTTAYLIVKFLEATMDTLDKHDKKVFFIVMDDCRIHHSAFVADAINKRGYKPLFMPPYSPFLNPIEECWSKIKSNIKRNPLDKADNLTLHLPGPCGSVTVQDCQGWIRHAETFWDRCINKELGLK
ncbi:hypothetical protein [Parasitella parasitica]|uniref:Tc1-like transposase DDE domain-containing protein n=1 Tax=Parasitella parasitica TaxID=35722 RepID=A0A0B7NC61_9FUNG|nr:hypothetical protein [Parasitella parasitica]